jgi:ribosomal protein S18 acetylase RimI-like enzyme
VNIEIVQANKEDLAKILEVQYKAFLREAEEFNDFNIDPMTQTLEDMEEEYKTFTYLKAVDENGQIIGSIRGYVKNGTSYIGRTLVHPDYQGRGVGTAMIKKLEQINSAPRYEINSSIRCPQNIRFYERLGFKKFKETKTENNGFVYLEK